MIRIILFASLVGVTIGLAGLLAADRMMRESPPPQEMATHERFPNVELQTHDGRTVRFYDDLIKGKIVAINFMYIACKSF